MLLLVLLLATPGESGMGSAADQVEDERPQQRWPSPVREAQSLAGKRIGISAGHGYLLESGTWHTQRSRFEFADCQGCRGITEDFFTQELVAFELAPLLRGMGAEIVVVREPWGTQMHDASGFPLWQLAAKYIVGGTNDVTTRPINAEAQGIDLYLSIHANASGVGAGTTANGTSTYRYSCQQYPDYTNAAQATGCDDPVGSTQLQALVHESMLTHLRAEWDPEWSDRGARVANFGEVRALENTPGILIETAFFDNVVAADGKRMSDNQALHDPRFREAIARGIAAGVARFFNAAATAPPTRPTGLFAARNADGSLHVEWAATPGATAYRLYTGEGRRWNSGQNVIGTSFDIGTPVHGKVYAFRVAAMDDNGEGYPSAAVVARVTDTATRVLVVDAFDRRDAWVSEQDNDLSASIDHGDAFAAMDHAVGFDGALDEATLAWNDYAFVDLVTGSDAAAQARARPFTGVLFDAGPGFEALPLAERVSRLVAAMPTMEIAATTGDPPNPTKPANTTAMGVSLGSSSPASAGGCSAASSTWHPASALLAVCAMRVRRRRDQRSALAPSNEVPESKSITRELTGQVC